MRKERAVRTSVEVRTEAGLRAEAVARVAAGERPVIVARDLDVSPPVLAAWLRVARDEAGGEPLAGEVAGMALPGEVPSPETIRAATEPLGDDALPPGVLSWDERVALITAGPQVRLVGRRKVVDFGNGDVAPASGRFRVTEGVPFPVEVHYRWSEDARRWIIHKVVCESETGVTGEALRSVALNRLLTNHIASQGARRAAEVSHDASRNQELAEVALVYAGAFARHLSPVVAVAEAFGWSRTTANKRVIAARKAGYLPPTTQGKAGA